MVAMRNVMPMIQETESVEVLTPDIAKEWLAKFGRPDNRRVKRARAEGYAELMKAGRWLCSKEHAISFDATGTILNGHHRLVGVTIAGIPVAFVVRRGVPVESLQFVDNHQARSSAQVARMLHIDTSWDPALRVVHRARGADTNSAAFVHTVALERLREEFASAADTAAPALRVRVAGRLLNAGTRAGLLLCARGRPLELIDFVADIDAVSQRTAVGARATQNLIRWIENRRGAVSSGAGSIDAIQTTVGAFEQFLSGEERQFVKSTGLYAKKSLLSELLRSPGDTSDRSGSTCEGGEHGDP